MYAYNNMHVYIHIHIYIYIYYIYIYITYIYIHQMGFLSSIKYVMHCVCISSMIVISHISFIFLLVCYLGEYKKNVDLNFASIK